MGFGPGAVRSIVESGVVTCTLELGAQAANATGNVTSRPSRSNFFISTSGTVKISLTVIAAMKPVDLELLIDQNGTIPLYNKSSLVGPPIREVCIII